MRPRRTLWIAAMLWATGWGSLDGHAGLYRCQRADGSVVYTDRQATCPGARPHEPRGEVQSVESTAVAKRRAPWAITSAQSR